MAGDGRVEGVGEHYIALWSIPFFRHLLVNVIGRLIQKVGTSGMIFRWQFSLSLSSEYNFIISSDWVDLLS